MLRVAVGSVGGPHMFSRTKGFGRAPGFQLIRWLNGFCAAYKLGEANVREGCAGDPIDVVTL